MTMGEGTFPKEQAYQSPLFSESVIYNHDRLSVQSTSFHTELFHAVVTFDGDTLKLTTVSYHNDYS